MEKWFTPIVKLDLANIVWLSFHFYFVEDGAEIFKIHVAAGTHVADKVGLLEVSHCATRTSQIARTDDFDPEYL